MQFSNLCLVILFTFISLDKLWANSMNCINLFKGIDTATVLSVQKSTKTNKDTLIQARLQSIDSPQALSKFLSDVGELRPGESINSIAILIWNNLGEKGSHELA